METKKLILCWIIMILINIYNIHISITEDIIFNIWSSSSEINITESIPIEQGDNPVITDQGDTIDNNITPLMLYKQKYSILKSRIKTSLDSNKHKLKQNIKYMVNTPSQYVNIKIDEAKLSNNKLSIWNLYSRFKKH